MFFLYLLVVVGWLRLMKIHSNNKVSMHYYFLGLLVVTCIECMLTYVEYDVYNSSG